MDVDENRDGVQSAELRAIFTEHLQFEDGMKVAGSDEPLLHAYFVIDGFLFQELNLKGKRSIVGVSVPGDFIGLSAIGSSCVGFDLVSSGRTVLGQVGMERFRSFVLTMPEFTVQALSRASAIQRQWIANCHRLNASQHIAHIYAELRHRLACGLGEVQQVVRTPFRQTDLGDMCGVSAIHANRAIATLRKAGIAEIRRGDLYTADWTILEAYAKFDPTYLGALLTLEMPRLSTLGSLSAIPLSALQT